MQIPNISDNEFLNVIAFNDLFSAVKTSLQEQNEGNMSPGLISPGTLAFSFSGLTVSVNAPLPFRIGFANGVLAKAMGTTDGQNTTNYSVDFSSFVPSSGSVVIYLLANTTPIQQDPYTIIGPPPGHPNYDPNFAPYLAYSTLDDSLNIFASTTAPDDKTTFELGRVTLTAGQTAITSIDTNHQVYSSSLLNPTGVASGTYTFPQLTIDPDGRILSATENTDIAFTNANNSFTGNNSFSNPLVVANATATDEALSLGQADSLFAALNGSSSENFATKALTSSSLITADGGLTVPSGQTETVAGTLDVTGTATIPNASAPNQPVALGQFVQSLGTSSSSNGYAKLPGGLTIQWGLSPKTATSAPYTAAVSFPIAFAQAVYVIVANDTGAGVDTYAPLISSFTLTGFTIQSSNPGGIAQYVAIGS